ncbi:right-handed parallel beta-helix repeat-containing protein [Coraliomargarita sp. SDUM461003]|uniref:Right-handed parallel beta-helix repeat-containing protein n=1 Tax=Thalassobacterium maritimum TaxID=3041265 RepID=A0ABU1AT15_9BACT|nr:right-handed parallel beta-helix repeat-containing protein [Coraliomargarita sp. SDUM461003]MDQ8207300.1 right-handed parallel beta-helix repeat-containing protein [Coraliomargarita sp. SDUM461003]
MRHIPKTVRLSLKLLLLGASALHAADYYVALKGAGTADGSSWENAFAFAQVDTVINETMEPGDTLYLEGNNYGSDTLEIKSSGTEAARMELIGVDRGVPGFPRPTFMGKSRSTNAGANIVLRKGASFWTVKNLQSHRRGWGLKTDGENRRLIIDSVYTHNTVNGFGFYDCDQLYVVNCKAERYDRYGIHLAHSCDDVILRKCYTDCSGTGDEPDAGWWRHANPVGFYFHTSQGSQYPYNTNILVEDCVTRNNRQQTPQSGDYEQGDGFMVEFRNRNLTFRRCLSYDNQQGAYDMKGEEQVFEDCYALRSGNGFKIWNDGTMTNCIAAETRGNTVMLIGKKEDPNHILNAEHCTFHVGTDGTGAAIWIERGQRGINQATLKNCLVTRAKSNSEYRKNSIMGGYSGAGGNVDLLGESEDRSYRYDETADLTNAPQYTQFVEPWRPWAEPDTASAFDSQQYGKEKGYHSKRTPSPLPVWAELIAKADRERLPRDFSQ